MLDNSNSHCFAATYFGNVSNRHCLQPISYLRSYYILESNIHNTYAQIKPGKFNRKTKSLKFTSAGRLASLPIGAYTGRASLEGPWPSTGLSKDLHGPDLDRGPRFVLISMCAMRPSVLNTSGIFCFFSYG